jgi:hypothetical protein
MLRMAHSLGVVARGCGFMEEYVVGSTWWADVVMKPKVTSKVLSNVPCSSLGRPVVTGHHRSR